MLISDWSSDVCSSDLELRLLLAQPVQLHVEVLPRGLLPRGAHGAQEERLAGEQPLDHADPGPEVVLGGDVRVLGAHRDRKSVREGKRVSGRVDLGGRGIIQKKIKNTPTESPGL